MEKFSTMLQEAKVDKNLVKAIEQDMKQYGGPASSDALERYLKAKMDKELQEAYKAYYKTSHGQKMISTFIEDAGMDPSDKDERSYYENEHFLSVAKIDLENVN